MLDIGGTGSPSANYQYSGRWSFISNPLGARLVKSRCIGRCGTGRNKVVDAIFFSLGGLVFVC